MRLFLGLAFLDRLSRAVDITPREERQKKLTPGT
jgi:hypothetical protein